MNDDLKRALHDHRPHATVMQHLVLAMRSLVSSNRMRHGLHIAVSLMAVFLLLKPFDCFSSTGKFTKESADCCKRGKCTPSTKDDCCKGTVPGGNVLVTADKAQQHELQIAPPDMPIQALPAPVFVVSSFHATHAPPGSPPGSRLNLPLLI